MHKFFFYLIIKIKCFLNIYHQNINNIIITFIKYNYIIQYTTKANNITKLCNAIYIIKYILLISFNNIKNKLKKILKYKK